MLWVPAQLAPRSPCSLLQLLLQLLPKAAPAWLAPRTLHSSHRSRYSSHPIHLVPRTSHRPCLLQLQPVKVALGWLDLGTPCSLSSLQLQHRPACQGGPGVACLLDSAQLTPTLATAPTLVWLLLGTSCRPCLIQLQFQPACQGGPSTVCPRSPSGPPKTTQHMQSTMFTKLLHKATSLRPGEVAGSPNS